MPVWSTIPVDEQPEITLIQWRVFEASNGNRYFNGWAIENREGRVSSAIIEFDNETMRGRTSSGRVYQLKGRQGYSVDAQYVLGVWLKVNNETWDSILVIDEAQLA
jgi:hypothetical protein